MVGTEIENLRYFSPLNCIWVHTYLGNCVHKFNHIPFPDYAMSTDNRKENELLNSYLVTIFSAKENNI